MNRVPRLAVLAAAALLAGAGFAAARKPAPKPAPEVAVDDLTVAAVRHVAQCPLPKLSSCVIRKPVDSGYRLLTPGIELDDHGDHWIADFAKGKETNAAKALLRVLGRNGDLHEIEVTFRDAAAPKGSRPQK